jgi:hypothetical protein
VGWDDQASGAGAGKQLSSGQQDIFAADVGFYEAGMEYDGVMARSLSGSQARIADATGQEELVFGMGRELGGE